MRYLITSSKTPAKVTLSYDGDGLLCEVRVDDIPEPDARLWPFRNAPLNEADLQAVLGRPHVKIEVMAVTFDDFWRRYAYKEGKKDAMKAWERMNDASRQLAYSYIDRYKAAAQRDRKHLMYPATYLRAERWLDHT